MSHAFVWNYELIATWDSNHWGQGGAPLYPETSVGATSADTVEIKNAHPPTSGPTAALTITSFYVHNSNFDRFTAFTANITIASGGALTLGASGSEDAPTWNGSASAAATAVFNGTSTNASASLPAGTTFNDNSVNAATGVTAALVFSGWATNNGDCGNGTLFSGNATNNGSTATPSGVTFSDGATHSDGATLGNNCQFHGASTCMGTFGTGCTFFDTATCPNYLTISAAGVTGGVALTYAWELASIPAVTGFTITRATNAAMTADVTTFNSTLLSYTDTTATVDVQYYYTVTPYHSYTSDPISGTGTWTGTPSNVAAQFWLAPPSTSASGKPTQLFYAFSKKFITRDAFDFPGVLGDGCNDDGAVLNAALAALPIERLRLNGTHAFYSSLIARSNLTIEGADSSCGIVRVGSQGIGNGYPKNGVDDDGIRNPNFRASLPPRGTVTIKDSGGTEHTVTCPIQLASDLGGSDTTCTLSDWQGLALDPILPLALTITSTDGATLENVMCTAVGGSTKAVLSITRTNPQSFSSGAVISETILDGNVTLLNFVVNLNGVGSGNNPWAGSDTELRPACIEILGCNGFCSDGMTLIIGSSECSGWYYTLGNLPGTTYCDRLTTPADAPQGSDCFHLYGGMGVLRVSGARIAYMNHMLEAAGDEHNGWSDGIPTPYHGIGDMEACYFLDCDLYNTAQGPFYAINNSSRAVLDRLVIRGGSVSGGLFLDQDPLVGMSNESVLNNFVVDGVVLNIPAATIAADVMIIFSGTCKNMILRPLVGASSAPGTISLLGNSGTIQTLTLACDWTGLGPCVNNGGTITNLIKSGFAGTATTGTPPTNTYGA